MKHYKKIVVEEKTSLEELSLVGMRSPWGVIDNVKPFKGDVWMAAVSTSSHGGIAIKLSDAQKNMTASALSFIEKNSYSYISGGFVWLEEDADSLLAFYELNAYPADNPQMNNTMVRFLNNMMEKNDSYWKPYFDMLIPEVTLFVYENNSVPSIWYSLPPELRDQIENKAEAMRQAVGL